MQTYHTLAGSARGCVAGVGSSSSLSYSDPDVFPWLTQSKLRSRLKGSIRVDGVAARWGCGCILPTGSLEPCRPLERRRGRRRVVVPSLTPLGSPLEIATALKSGQWSYSVGTEELVSGGTEERVLRKSSWFSGQSIAAIALGSTLLASPLCPAVELQGQDVVPSCSSSQEEIGYHEDTEDVHQLLEKKVATDFLAEMAFQKAVDSGATVDDSPSMCSTCVPSDSDLQLAVASGPDSITMSAITALAPVAAATSAATVAALSPGAASIAARVAVSSSEAATVASGALATLQPPVATVAAPNLIARLGSSFVTGLQHLAGGGFAGAVGATVVYPLDTVKTKMQVQGKKEDGEPEYKDSLDCFYQLVTKEGPASLYSGLLPQLVGIAPEKAVKLTVNELLLSFLEAQLPGNSRWTLELLAGAGGGGSQVVFTNPVEIVKVRLQTQPCDSTSRPKTAMEVVKELGLGGLYNGTSMCLARDVPSTALFFGAYAFLKPFFPGNTFLAGAIAAAPATLIVTPFDVIKTRLQMELPPGEAPYKGPWDCMVRLVNEEGLSALFRGGLTRVLRVSPQFGITIMIYDLLS